MRDADVRHVIADLDASRIREVANAGLGRSDVLAFWFGESDEPTPAPVCQAAIRSIEAGEVFYAHNLGLPELREAQAAYISSLHPAVSAERVAITSSGVSALMLAQQLLVDAGDEVVAVVPVWPNLTAQPAILGARVKRVSLHPHEGAWQLDLDELLAAITPATRVLIVNSPNNPTGWTLTHAEIGQILAHCRRTGTWIVSDEVYERLYFADAAAAAPSFLDLAEPDDRLLVVHSFSKSFLMTGWRLGSLVVPPRLMEHLGKLIEFNTSCAPVFVQRAGLAALAAAPDAVPALRARLRHCRDTLVGALRELPRVELAMPPGAMYAFLRVDGEADSLALAKRLVHEHGLGLAPGVAFGAEGEGWLRWCFASKQPERLLQGVDRLAAALRL
ncbi:aminotransferase [Sphaerotilus microaerophilus]|uniref:Aminotransferase n=1 Tax=Sphaerotilus microaerophilus TaxID=2914710 RepID=A0ABM7YJI1_9BURK|nr:aminotransferase [Sphaerotilus sp. FB-5]